MLRQGDVMLVSADIPADAKVVERKGAVVLAYGEVTGHAHTITEPDVQEFVLGAQRFIRVTKLAQLTHQEHGTIAVAPGDYKVIQQREYSPEEIRRVAD